MFFWSESVITHFLGVYMKTFKLDQAKLLGFRICPRLIKSKLVGIGAKAGKVGKGP
jgi:hypothetical protein